MKQVPLLFVMMSRRRKQDYAAVLRKTLDILEEAPVVESFSMDFEVGLWQALREVFPGTSLKGCGFHWAQAVQRKVQEVGHLPAEGGNPFDNQKASYPVIPSGERYSESIPTPAGSGSRYFQPLQEVFEYVHGQWIDSSLWSTEEWSVYRQPVRTNNDT